MIKTTGQIESRTEVHATVSLEEPRLFHRNVASVIQQHGSSAFLHKHFAKRNSPIAQYASEHHLNPTWKPNESNSKAAFSDASPPPTRNAFQLSGLRSPQYILPSTNLTSIMFAKNNQENQPKQLGTLLRDSFRLPRMLTSAPGSSDQFVRPPNRVIGSFDCGQVLGRPLTQFVPPVLLDDCRRPRLRLSIGKQPFAGLPRGGEEDLDLCQVFGHGS